jgi:N-acetylglucosaminyldiphosphoundecaprenol N-acetyl-beta-D-mannosaminyltransferase
MQIRIDQEDHLNAGTDNKVRFRVLSSEINAISWEQTFQTIRSWIDQKQPHYVNVCSVQTVMESNNSPVLTEIINTSGMSVPDGMPLVWIGKLKGHFTDRIYGPDLVLEMCRRGLDLGYRHFLYGAGPGVAEKMAENLKKRFPGLNIVGWHSPPYQDMTDEEAHKTADMINKTQPDIVWVGLGTPKQDYWMSRMRPYLEAPVLIAVGAAFDLHSGRLRQAPIWMRRAGLEWFFRLLMEPRRLWRRYLIGNPRFIYLICRQFAKR